MRSYVWLILVLVVISIPLFSHLTELPVQLWDEARQATSAYEMLHTGNAIVLTYDYKPDMWSTKPPLLIWIMALSMKLFGCNELGIRLPSAIIAVFTFLVLFWFVIKTTGNKRLAFLSCFVLVTTTGFVKEHGTRTGDYDTLLTFCTTGYMFFYYLYMQEWRKKYLVLFFICLTAAALTKGIAGLLLLPALFIYTVYVKGLVKLLKTPQVYIGLATFLVVIMGYYITREHYNPGYIDAVMMNELGGRFNTTIEGHVGGPMYYMELLKNSNFTYWCMFLVLGIPVGLLSDNVRIKNIVTYLLMCSVIFYIIISAAGTKLPWYDMPVFPLLSIIAALVLDYAYGKISRANIALYRKRVLLFLFTLLLFAIPYCSILGTTQFPKEPGYMEDNNAMASFLKLAQEGSRNINGYIFTADSKEDQNIVYYIKVLGEKNHLRFKEIEAMGKNDTVVVFKDNAKQRIGETYETDKIYSFGRVDILKITGLKKKPYYGIE